MQPSDITVLIACKNRKQNLTYCLASIDQCIEHPNVILVDYGSDQPVDADYPWLTILRVEASLFYKSHALNIGLRNINTPYVLVTDADQIFRPDFFRVVMDHLVNKNTFILCWTLFMTGRPEEHGINPTNIGKEYNRLFDIAKQQTRRPFGDGCCHATSTSWMVSTRGYDERFVGWGYEDDDVSFRAHLLGMSVSNIWEKTSMIHLSHSRESETGQYHSALFANHNKDYFREKKQHRISIGNTTEDWGIIKNVPSSGGGPNMVEPISFIIPTHRPFHFVEKQVEEMQRTISLPGELIVTCSSGSAAYNRNIGLNRAKHDLILMVDDDMTGFYPGWDNDLINPMLADRSIVMISARLLKKDGTPGVTMSGNYDMSKDLVPSLNGYLPTACVAFWKSDLRFDETFIGSGFEDTDFCCFMRRKYPQGKFFNNNKCKLIHLNEMKNQHDGDIWDRNQKYYISKWGRLL